MEYLRWILLAIGIGIVGLIYWLGRRQQARADWQGGHAAGGTARASQRPRPRRQRRSARQEEAEVGAAATAAEDEAAPVWNGSAAQPEPEADTEATAEPVVTAPPKPAATEANTSAARAPGQEQIIVVHVAARRGRQLAGEAVLKALEKAGLELGEMQIYHRMMPKGKGQVPVFSVANMIKPGTLDADTMHGTVTPGVSFFLRLPGPLVAVNAYNVMLGAATQVAQDLDAQVLDQDHELLTHQMVETVRQELGEGEGITS